jgi:hypothetical protein
MPFESKAEPTSQMSSTIRIYLGQVVAAARPARVIGQDD